jgi:hypothetical protein
VTSHGTTHFCSIMEVALSSYSADEPAIHRLVDDILAYIFLLNATLPDPDRREHATTVASSQVCSRWRSIALNCHTIWGPIIDYPEHSLKWIETLLDRSNPSSLDFGRRVNSVFLPDREQSVLELVFNHIDRLRIFNLHFHASFSNWELVCSRFLQSPAPNLEFVRVSIIPNAGHSSLTHPLFDNHAPNLQNLQLLRCMVDFTSPVLTSLTELYVNHDNITQANAVPTVFDWLNILRGMPSLRWVTLIRAISSTPANVIYPVIHLAALEMLSVDGEFNESVTLVEHLIVPPRCGLRVRCHLAHAGVVQRKLWAIIEKTIDSWARNAPNRQLVASSTQGSVYIGNLPSLGPGFAWGAEAEDYNWHKHLLDPVMTITLSLSNPQDTVPLFLSLFALFERTFFDTTYLRLWIEYELDDGAEVFLPLVDSFRGFVNLEKVYLGYDSLSKFLFPLLQHSLANSVLLPALKSLMFYDAMFRRTSVSLPRVADFLQWRKEQGFPVQKINIVSSRIDREYILTHIRDTAVEIHTSNSDLPDTEEDSEEDNN